MEAVLRMPRQLAIRLRTSPLLLALAGAPMLVIIMLVAALVWISFQSGLVGTPKATYTLQNYTDILGDPFVLTVVWNTVIFTLATTFTALTLGLPIAWHLLMHRRGIVRVAALIYLVTAPVGLLLTATRGAFVAGVAAVAIVLLLPL